MKRHNGGIRFHLMHGYFNSITKYDDVIERN